MRDFLITSIKQRILLITQILLINVSLHFNLFFPYFEQSLIETVVKVQKCSGMTKKQKYFLFCYCLIYALVYLFYYFEIGYKSNMHLTDTSPNVVLSIRDLLVIHANSHVTSQRIMFVNYLCELCFQDDGLFAKCSPLLGMCLQFIKML